MTPAQLLVLNLEQVRRRSLIVWRSIPGQLLHFRPDPGAMSCVEMVRHVLESDFMYGEILRLRRSYKGPNPFEGREYTDVAGELTFGAPFRKSLLATVGGFSEPDLDGVTIDRSDVGYKRKAGDFILRIAYHESVHTGQLLQYLRAAGSDRPSVWD